MIRVTAVIPVKPFKFAKQRLSGLLNSEERYELASAMFQDTLILAAAATIVSDVIIATSDPHVKRIAENDGLRILSEPTCGLNEAVDQAAAFLSHERVECIAVLPTDLPMARPDDLLSLVTSHVGLRADLTVATARKDRGTNCLVMSPPGLIQACFGEFSSSKHIARARGLGLTAHALSIPGLEWDIDDASDIAHFMKRAASGRTWNFLSGLKITERLAAVGQPWSSKCIE